MVRRLTINTRELVRKIGTETSIEEDLIVKTLDSLSMIFNNAVSRGDPVILKGFGKFIPTFQPGHEKSVPFQSATKILVKDKWKLRFLPATKIKASLSSIQ